MAGRVTLVTLVLFFLAALMVHYLMAAKESFANPPTTPLTKETLKQELDTIVTELYSDYLKLTKEKSDDRIKARIVFYSEMLTALNNIYTRLDTSPIPPSVTVQDVQLVRQFILYTLSPVYISSVKTPATASDLSLFLTRLQSTVRLLTPKIQLSLGSIQSGPVIQQLNSAVAAIISNTNVLMKKLPMMKPEEIPVFKTDRYLGVLALAFVNFVISPEILNGPTIPVIDALPIGTTPGVAISTLLQPTAIAPVATPQPVANSPTGFKFSELVKSLMSYDGIAAAQTQSAQVQPSPSESGLIQKSVEPKPTTTDMNNLKEFVSDEIDAKLTKYKLGPKDVQNINVVDRKTNPVTTETPEASSNALEQGKWFRNENSAACPYATGQQATGSPQPNPIDMNDYVRKDSIPCWGCNLK